MKIINAFQQYVKYGNKEAIKNINEQEIRQALGECLIEDRNQRWYQEMENRLTEFKVEESKNKEKQESKTEKWKDRAITFVLGILGGLFIAYLKAKLKIEK